MRKIKKIAVNSVLKAGVMALKEYRKFDRSEVTLKKQNEILTKVDVVSEGIIIKDIEKFFPDHSVLAEESGDNEKESDYKWIIDPIDGTTNFSIHNPIWCISLGITFKEEVVFGVIYAPVLDELFIVEKGKGIECNGKKCKVSGVSKKERAINTFCYGSLRSDMKKALKYYNRIKINSLDCRQLGSAALELAYVACGRVESIMIPGVNAWDVAAGALMVREAGGRVSDFDGKKWNLKSRDILASNRKLHKQILKDINKK